MADLVSTKRLTKGDKHVKVSSVTSSEDLIKKKSSRLKEAKMMAKTKLRKKEKVA